MAQKMLTKENLKALPKLYSTDGQGDQAIAQVKYFLTGRNWTFYATEYDPETETFFGYLITDFPELCYMTLEQIQQMRGQFRLPVERDLWFKPTKLADIKANPNRY